jgi:hypothetical protein
MSGNNRERDLSTKAFGAFDIKDADKGEVEAIIATLNVVDRDREVILPGAIPDGTPVKLSGYGHSAMYGEAPVGKGYLVTKGDKIHFKGSFFLGTQRGAEAFATAKALGSDQEWSFGFRIVEAANATEEWLKQGALRILQKLAAFEVSPVIVGAGIGTQTLALKSEGGAPEEDAEAKAAADLAVERQQAEAARQEDERAAQRAALKASAAEEFDRFQRNLRRFAR